jgi:21S rRNA (GM2251-2'-O)-methyltransferase
MKKSFDANFVQPKTRKKAWEGKSKDEFFGTTYANEHRMQSIRAKQSNRQKHKKSLVAPPPTKKMQQPKIVKVSDENKEYLYGTRVILSVIESTLDGRRKIFELYTSNENATTMPAIKEYCQAHQIKINYKTSKQDLNRLCDNGLHNGYVALVSRRDYLSISELGKVSTEENSFAVKSIQRLASTENTTFAISAGKANPLGIYIDEITDARNLGAIIRSSYYLGADFIIRSDRSSANITPVAVKTSSGATEHIPILSAQQPLKFFDATRLAGWNIIATTLDPVNKPSIKTTPVSGLNKLLAEGPCLMVLGSEGDGLRTNLLNRSTHVVRWNGLVPADKLDSLNVSVAAALLLSKFHREDRFD